MPGKIARILFFLAAWSVLVLYWTWAVGAAWHYTLVPKTLRVLLAVAYIAIPLAVSYRTRSFRFVATTVGCVIGLMAVCWQFLQPSNDRNWETELANPPAITINGDRIDVEHYMAFDASTTRSFDLNSLQRVWFGVEKFEGFDGGAHNFLTFEFADGQYVAVSVEARREQGERYGVLPALFRQFELIYLMGDEAQVFAKRSDFAAPTYLYPLKSTPKERRALLLDICRRMNGLRNRPEWYNILTNNCTNNLAWHASRIAPRPISSYDTRVILTGHADELLFELGMIDIPGELAEIERSCQMDQEARKNVVDADFSRRIRQKMTGP